MRSGATDMPLQLELYYRFMRAIKERLRSDSLLHSSQVLLPTGFQHHILQEFTEVMSSKGTQTI